MENNPKALAFRNWHEMALTVLGIAIAILTWAQRYRFAFDDSFITFRYAEHVASDQGFVWNVGGPHTEGYTNFLYVMLLAPSFWLHVDPLVWAWLVNIAALIASALLIYKLSVLLIERELRAASTYIPLLVASFFLLTPLVWINAFSAMETTLFGSLLLFSAYFFAKSHYLSRSFTPSFVFALLAALTRPEGALLGIVFFVVLVLYRRDHWRETLIFVLPLLGYHAARLIYFGDIFPNSFIVKVLGTGNTALLHGTAYIRLFLMSTLGVALATLPLFRHFTKRRIVLALLVFCALVLGFYAFPVPLMGFYDRFLYSIEVFLFVLGAVGFTLLWKRTRPAVGLAIGIALIALHAYASLRFPRAKEAFGSSDFEFKSYSRIASILHYLPGHDSISFAFGDAGVIPFYSGLRHLDLVGLNDNELARTHQLDQVEQLIIRRQPDMIFVPIDLPRPDDDSCRHALRIGHGVIGSHYIDLVHDQRFQDYHPLVMFHARSYDVVILERIHSPFARTIEAGFFSRLDRDSDLITRPPLCLD